MKEYEALESLERIEAAVRQMMQMLNELLTASRRTAATKKAYSINEAAKVLQKAPYTVREWARLGRINATKRPIGRGCEQEWEISHAEIERIQNHGLLPIPRRY